MSDFEQDFIPKSEIPFSEEIRNGMTQYTEYVAEDRAIPSIIDGMKPSVRRLLYTAVKVMGMTPKSKTQKSMKLIGTTMGSFHPHGDSGTYSGLVTATSSSNALNPLFSDEQGNWGDSSFGDNAAAPRYTEVVVSELGYALMADHQFLDMVPNYDGTDYEPVCLCPPIPTLFLNDNIGVGSGIATSVPSHCISDICDATLAFIRNNNCRDSTLLEAIKAPDHVAGGILMDYEDTQEGLRNLYLEGKGRLYFSVDWSLDKSADPEFKHLVTVRSVCPGLTAVAILEGEMFTHLIENGEIKILDNSSGTLDIQIQIYYNNPAVIVDGVLPQLQDYAQTYNINVIDYETNFDGILREKKIINTSLRYSISRWLTYRREVVTRRIEARIEELQWELEKYRVQYYLATHEVERDEMFNSKSEEELQRILTEVMGFNERQAGYAPSIQLRTIIRLNEDGLIKSMEKVERQIDEQQRMADDLDGTIAAEVREFKRKFGGERRLKLYHAPEVPKVVHSTYLIATSEDGTIKAHADWPSQGKGLGKCTSAAFCDAYVTVLNDAGKVISMPPFEVSTTLADTYIYGVASDQAELLAIVDEDYQLYIREVPAGGFDRWTKVTRGSTLTMVGIAPGQGLVVQMNDGKSFQFFSWNVLKKLAKTTVRPSYEVWWSDDCCASRLIPTGVDCELVNSKGKLIDIDWDDHETLWSGGVRAIDLKNLITYDSGRASILSAEDAHKTLATVAESIPLFGDFGTN